ncbi:MAG: SurA N-terminal domain-containing protein [Pseudomonadota bacterium]
MAKKKGNTITLVLIGLMIVSLFGFGVTNFGGSNQAVATVGDAEVTAGDYIRAVEGQISAFQQQTGQAVTFQQAQAFGLDRVALGQLITDAAIANETAQLGISAGDDNVAQELQSISSFQNVGGEFDPQTYRLALRQSGINPDEFEADIRARMAESLVRQAVGAGIETPQVYIDTLFNFARETRDVTWARLTAEDLPEPIAAPTEADLAAFHEANPEPFTRPETKVISYAWLSPDTLAENVEVSEEQARAVYEERISDYVREERRLVERLVYSDATSAEAAKARLDAGEASFDDLVGDRGLTLADVDLGDVSQSDLGDAGAAIFALTEPGVAGPLPSSLGPALYRMNGILAAENIDFEEVRDEMTTIAATDRARRIIQDTVPQVEDLLAGGADMALLAERTDMVAGTIDWNEEVFEGIAAFTAFRRAAAATGVDAFPEVTELQDGGIVVIDVESIEEPALRPLEEVRDAVTEAWTTEQTQNALKELAEDVAQQIRDGREMASGGLGLNLNVNTDLLRDAALEGTPPSFVTTLFDLAPEELAVTTADGDAWILRLDAITPPDPDNPEAALLMEQFSVQTAQELSTAVTQAFIQSIVDQAGVEINQGALAAVAAQLP